MIKDCRKIGVTQKRQNRFYLPKTIVQVTLPAKETTAAPGDFAKFAPISSSKRM